MGPYKGLQPYTEEDEKFFFGRDAERAMLHHKILSNKLTLLFSATGAGKSSLLQAAVMPDLKRLARENLDVVYYNDWITPPLKGLKQKILQVLQEGGKVDLGFTLDEELSLENFLHICATFASEPLVIILDQFEEFFQYQRYTKMFVPFIAQFSESIRNHELSVAFLISMREDFALNLNAFKKHLSTTLFENYYRLEKLELKVAEQAIRKPIEKFGFRYEDGLLEELLQDLADQEREGRIGSRKKLIPEGAAAYVEPPNMQIVCTQLWELEKNNPDKIIRRQTYIEKNRADGFVNSYFGGVIEDFSDSEKKLASKAFNHLVTPRGTKMAYPVKDLSDLLRVNEEGLGNVLAKLEKARVLRSQSRKGVIWYELYHDIFSGIINQWNNVYKAKQRFKNAIITTGIIGCILLVFMLLILSQPVRYHFRLSTTPGQIELYRGKANNWDIFRRERYEAETPYIRSQLEPDKQFIEKDKRFTKIPIADYDDLNLELIGKLPTVERISAYWEIGAIDQALRLADNTISKDDLTRTQQVINLLANFRSQQAFAVLAKHLDPSEDDAIRTSIISIMSAIQFTGVTDALMALLTDQSSSVQLSAVKALGQRSRDEAVEALQAVLNHENPEVRRNAEEVLAHINGKEMIQPFKHYGGYVENNGIDSFNQPNTNEAIDSLVQSLYDQDWNMRHNAALTLVQIGSRDVLDRVKELLHDPDLEIRCHVAWILGHLGSGESIEPLLALLKNQNTYIQSRAAEALGELESVEAVEMLVEQLKKQDIGWTNIVWVLGNFGRSEAVVPLMKLLKAQDWDVQSNAIWALGKLGSNEAVRPLIEMLDNRNSYLRGRAAEALGRIGDADAVSALLGRLKDEDQYVQRNAALALGKLSAHGAIDSLKYLYSQGGQANLATAAVLLHFKQEDGLESLKRAAESRDISKRKEIAVVLGEVPSKQGNELLRNMLEDESIEVQIQVITSLGHGRALSALPDLQKLLSENHNLQVQETIIKALGEITSAESINLLKSIALNTQARVSIRLSAINGLSNIKKEKAITALLEILEKIEEHYQYKIIIALGKTQSSNAVAPLLKHLEIEEQRREQWRTIRDENIASYTEKQKQEWEAQLEEVRPRWYVEFELAYAIAQIDPGGAGVKLLSHNLYAVREGACMGLGGTGDISLIQRLDKERIQSQNPIFHRAAYRAIDKILIHIQAYGKNEEFIELENILSNVKDQEGVKTRVEWTISRLKERVSS